MSGKVISLLPWGSPEPLGYVLAAPIWVARESMSDVQPRPDWWRASDGRWYPPEQHPDYRRQGVVATTAQSHILEAPEMRPEPNLWADDPYLGAQVEVIRRVRGRQLPCGRCSERLPRLTALAPAVLVCPRCGQRLQVTEGFFFRRIWAVD